MIVMAMAQQKGGQLLTGLTQTADRRKTGAHEIADRLMGRIGNPDSGQFARPVQLGQADRVPAVGLIRSPGLRGISDGATMTHSCPARVNCR